MSTSQLSGWKSGDEGVITALEDTSPSMDRLRELGLMPGAWVRVIQPGSPMLIQVGDSRICLRREDARHIGAHVETAPRALSRQQSCISPTPSGA